jgi:hypothetical protein
MKGYVLKSMAVTAFMGLIMLMGGCGATQEPLSAEQWDKMEKVVASQNFVFVARFAEPIGDAVKQIDLTGRVNYMSLQGDQVKMELPYFGTRQVANMSGDRGLRFETTATDISTRKNEKQNHYDMNFKARDRSESFSCNLRVYSGLLAVLTINSSQRNSIMYTGELRPID